MDSYVVCLFLVAVLVCPLGYGLNPLSLTLQAMDQLLEIKSEDFVGARGYECSQSACRCAKEVKMHCATDGKSFRKFINRCYMICEACTTGVPWHNAQYPWQCDADARHRRSAEELHTDRIVPTMTQPAFQRCPRNCETAVGDILPRYVCGSDGVTYKSFCHLDQTSCVERREISAAHAGPC